MQYQKSEGMYPSCHWVSFDHITNTHLMCHTPREQWDAMTEEDKILATKNAFLDTRSPDSQSHFQS
jgi:hypothetical protein